MMWLECCTKHLLENIRVASSVGARSHLGVVTLALASTLIVNVSVRADHTFRNSISISAMKEHPVAVIHKMSDWEKAELIRDLKEELVKRPVSPSVYAEMAGNISIGTSGRFEGDRGGSGSTSERAEREACDDAATALLVFLSELREEDKIAEFYVYDGETLSAEQRESYLHIMDEYDEHCLDGPDGLPRSIAERISALVSGDGKPFCAGVRLNDDVLVTAYHCVHYAMWRFGGSRFEFVSGKSKELGGHLYHRDDRWDVEELLRNRRELMQHAKRVPEDMDFSVRILARNGSGPSFPRLGSIDQKKYLTLIGWNKFIQIARALRDQPRNWRESVRSSKQSCFAALAEEGGCIYHGCQSAWGMSGSGLFQGETLVGIHLGAAPGWKCRAKQVGSWGNFGFRLPELLSNRGHWYANESYRH